MDFDINEFASWYTAEYNIVLTSNEARCVEVMASGGALHECPYTRWRTRTHLRESLLKYMDERGA